MDIQIPKELVEVCPLQVHHFSVHWAESGYVLLLAWQLCQYLFHGAIQCRVGTHFDYGINAVLSQSLKCHNELNLLALFDKL